MPEHAKLKSIFMIIGDYIIMCVHVDDSVVCSNLQEGLDYYKEEFSKHVKEI